jgi:hypothetical protein
MSTRLSVVILARSGAGPVLNCLDALTSVPEWPGLEVIVANACGEQVAGKIGRRFRGVIVIPVPAGLTLAQQRDLGVRRAQGEVVALLHERYAVGRNWVKAILAAHQDDCDAAAGPVDAGLRLSLAGWAMYLYEYAHVMPPEPDGFVPPGEAFKLPGSNIAYKRRVFDLAAMADSLWELDFHARLLERGARFCRCAGMRADFSYAFTLREYLSERFRVSYDFAALRASALGPARCFAAGAARAALPALVVARIASKVAAKRRHRLRLAASLPWILCFTAVQAVGEALGYWSFARKAPSGVAATGAAQ